MCYNYDPCKKKHDNHCKCRCHKKKERHHDWCWRNDYYGNQDHDRCRKDNRYDNRDYDRYQGNYYRSKRCKKNSVIAVTGIIKDKQL